MDAYMYLDLWLSEQIPISDWIRILDTRPDVEEVYKEHIEEHHAKD